MPDCSIAILTAAESRRGLAGIDGAATTKSGTSSASTICVRSAKSREIAQTFRHAVFFLLVAMSQSSLRVRKQRDETAKNMSSSKGTKSASTDFAIHVRGVQAGLNWQSQKSRTGGVRPIRLSLFLLSYVERMAR